MAYLSRRLTTPLKPFPSPSSSFIRQSENGDVHPCRQTQLICEIYNRLAVSLARKPLGQRASEAVSFITESGLDGEWLADLPYGIATPILEMMRVCQTSPPPDFSAKGYAFVGRTDLAVQSMGKMETSRDIPFVGVSDHIGRGLMPAGRRSCTHYWRYHVDGFQGFEQDHRIPTRIASRSVRLGSAT